MLPILSRGALTRIAGSLTVCVLCALQCVAEEHRDPSCPDKGDNFISDKSAQGGISRPVAEDELRWPRGEVEDKLRKEVLAAFEDEERLVELREILNGPWGDAAVLRLADLVLTGAPLGVPPDVPLRIDSFQWRAIAKMLAYLSKTYPDTSIAVRVQEVFEKFFERARLLDYSQRMKSCFWGGTEDAVRECGTKELLTPSFWKALEDYSVSNPTKELLAQFGDETCLANLRQVREKARWEKDSSKWRMIDDMIFLVESQLKFPPLRKIRKTGVRLSIARWLDTLGGIAIRALEKRLETEEEGEVKDALRAILVQLKEEGRSPRAPE